VENKTKNKTEKPVKLIVTRLWEGWKQEENGELTRISKMKTDVLGYENHTFAFTEMQNFKKLGYEVKICGGVE
jgi:hypothetical protein